MAWDLDIDSTEPLFEYYETASPLEKHAWFLPDSNAQRILIRRVRPIADLFKDGL